MISDFDTVKYLLIAGDVANQEVSIVSQDDDLDFVLRLLTKLNVDQVPVVDKDLSKQVLGAITKQEILSVYNRESLKLNLAEGLSKELKTIRQASPATVAKGYSIAEISVPHDFIGKSISELKIRNKYGLEVLMIKQPQKLFDESLEKDLIITTNPDYRLKRNDKLVLFGMDENIEKLRNI
jgi:CBS-domain-containing membrane protein